MTEVLDEMRKMMQQHMRLVNSLTSKLATVMSPETAPANNTQSIDGVANSITEFAYDPAAHVTFETWFKRYADMFKSDLAAQDDSWKVRLLLRKLGPAEHERYANYILPKEPRDVLFQETVETLTHIFSETSTIFNIRYQCLQITKHESDDYVKYMGLVNREASRFQLGTLSEDQFKCLLFICGLRSPKEADVRTRLLAKLHQDPKVTLHKMADECNLILNLKHDSSMVEGPSSTRSIHTVSTNASRYPDRPKPNLTPPSPCRHCGAWHFHRDCPFKENRCQKCAKVGHRDGFCHQRSTNVPKPTPSSFQSTRAKPQARRQPIARTHHLTIAQVNKTNFRKFISVLINGVPIKFQLDTGSDITIISHSTWRTMGSPALQKTSETATSACGGRVSLSGCLHGCVSFRETTISGSCYVANTELNLLGLDWFEQLGLTKRPIDTICNHVQSTVPSSPAEQLVNEFTSVFQNGLGLCTFTQAKLQLSNTGKPVFRPKRPVPYAALPLVDEELKRLESMGVLQPVTYSAWAAPIVVVKKPNGSIRLCADFSTGLNAALESNCYPLPVPEDIFTILNGGTCYAKIDLAEAYLQIEVSPASRELLTINTHRGLFQYTRLPFGVKTAPAIFQQIMDTLLTGITGTAAYLDDIIIMGRTPAELHDRTTAVLQRIQEYGFRLHPEKCEFFLQSIQYLGFIFDENGRHPNPENIRAIQQMPPPADVPQLRSFLGLVSYYSAFLPSMHNVRAPLNQLLQKDSTWNWSPDCQRAFAQLKSMLSSDLLLTHFNPQLPIIVAADASNYGVGAVLSHVFPDNTQKAVIHAARTLTPAEKNYGQIEKEALALIFAVKKFHKMIYGRHFTLLTDHKPLLSIFGSKKGIPAHSANRLQRWATIMLGYNFTIEYRRTEEFGQADALSRLISSHPRAEEDAVIAVISVEDTVQHQLSDAIRGIPVTATDVRQATLHDSTLQDAIRYTQSGWPNQPPSGDLHQLYERRDSLSVVDSCLMFTSRVVIPYQLRHIVLRQFHAGHPGISRMKAIARSYAYWPGMDRHIDDFVRHCSRCQQAAKNPPHQVPIPWQPTKFPWSRLHIDFAGPINGMTYFVLVDAHSKWPEIFPIISPTTSNTILILDRLFSQHGVPDTIVSDNGTQFTSAIFSDYCKRHAIQHIFSPPYHPQSNGQAERFVDTLKRALLKAKGEGTTEEILQRFLLVYRTTPNKQLPEHQTPAEVLMNRKLRTTLSAMVPSARPPPPAAVSRNSFVVGTKVYARDYRPGHDKWAEATVSTLKGNVLYEVTVSNQTWIRHHNQLRLRAGSTATHQSTSHLPWNLLLDTFELATVDQTMMEQTVKIERPPERLRRPTKHIQVDPRQSSYRRH